jgi:3-oxoacyl-[acyl-carrier-protein] synthase III
MTKLEKLELELKEMLKNNSIKNQSKELFNENGFQYKKKAKQEMDKFLNKMIKKNGTTKY